jgi:DNA polymerase-3 subunit delta
VSAKLRAAVGKAGAIVWFAALDAKEAAEYIQRQARRAGVHLDQSAAAMLVSQRLGTDLATLRRELDKLVLFVGEGKVITCAHVEAMTPRLLEDKIWDLTDALSLGKAGLASALVVLRRMLQARDEPGRILPSIVSHIRFLWQVKGLLEIGWRPGQPVQTPESEEILIGGGDALAARFSKQTWLAGKSADQARRFTWSQLERALIALSDCDRALKGLSPALRDGGMALELALITICSDPKDLPA